MEPQSNDYSGALRFEIIERGDVVRAVMPVTREMLNPFGTVHAGAMIWFADVTATICAIGDRETGPDGAGFPLVVDLHTVLVANQRDGELLATAKPIRRGRRIANIRTTVTGEGGRLLIDVTTTHMYAG